MSRFKRIFDWSYQGDDNARRERTSDFSPQRLPPSTDLLDNPVRCLVVNAEWMSFLSGQVERLAFHEAWEGDHTVRSDAIEKITQILSMMGECGLITDLRQSPTNACVMEYSKDGGDTWLEAMNFHECIGEAVRPIVEQTGIDIIDELLEKWDGTADSITEHLTYDGSPDDVFRDYALCNALQLFIDAMAEAELNRRFKSIQIWEDVPEILVGIGGILWVTPIPGARVVAFGLALTAAALQVGLPAWGILSQADLENETARDNIACVMYERMKGVTPTFSAFQTSLDSLPYVYLSPEWNIASGVKPMLQELEVFVTFLQIWDSVYPLAEAGFLDDCTCPDLGWTVEFLGGAGRPPNWSFPSNAPYESAKYNSPGDYWFADETASEPEKSAYCTVEFYTAAVFEIDWIMFDIDLESSGPNTFNSGQQFWLYNDVGGLIENHNEPGYHQNNTPAIIAWEKNNIGIKTIKLQARIFEPDNGVTTYARMEKIVIHGSGTIPPEWASFEV